MAGVKILMPQVPASAGVLPESIVAPVRTSPVLFVEGETKLHHASKSKLAHITKDKNDFFIVFSIKG
jgi:hypothetical protein